MVGKKQELVDAIRGLCMIATMAATGSDKPRGKEAANVRNDRNTGASEIPAPADRAARREGDRAQVVSGPGRGQGPPGSGASGGTGMAMKPRDPISMASPLGPRRWPGDGKHRGRVAGPAGWQGEARAALAEILAKSERAGAHPLTAAEEAVMILVLTGLGNGLIARILRRSVETVQMHTDGVRRKYGVETRTAAAVVFALRTLLTCCRPGRCEGLRSQLLPPRDAVSEAGGRTRTCAAARAVLASILTADMLPQGGSPAALWLAEWQGAKARPLLRPPAYELLSPKEGATLAQLLRGLLDKHIAESLGVEASTARTHLDRALQKLRQPNRVTAAVALTLWACSDCCQPSHCGGLRSRLLRLGQGP